MQKKDSSSFTKPKAATQEESLLAPYVAPSYAPAPAVAEPYSAEADPFGQDFDTKPIEAFVTEPGLPVGWQNAPPPNAMPPLPPTAAQTAAAASKNPMDELEVLLSGSSVASGDDASTAKPIPVPNAEAAAEFDAIFESLGK